MERRVQRRLAAGAAVMAALAISGPAAAAGGGLIVPGRSIGPIAMGDERARIALRHGDGIVASRTPNPEHPQPNSTCGERPLPALSLVVGFPDGRGEQRRRPARDALPRLPYAPRGGRGDRAGRRCGAPTRRRCPDAGACRIGRALPGRVVTRFLLGRGQVARVDIRRVFS